MSVCTASTMVPAETGTAQNPSSKGKASESVSPAKLDTVDDLVAKVNDRTRFNTSLSSVNQHEPPFEDSTVTCADVAVLPPPLAKISQPLFFLKPLKTVPVEADILDHDVRLLLNANHSDPFGVLGPHFFNYPGSETLCSVVRVWKKDASFVRLCPIENHYFAWSPEVQDNWCFMLHRWDWLYQLALEVIPAPGLRQSESQLTTVEGINERLKETPFFYHIQVQFDGDPADTLYTLRDTYNFNLLLPEYDLQFFQAGSCWHVDNLMGSHIMTLNGVEGVRFSVWAPKASVVSVVGDWNQWDARAHPMRHRIEFGVWELFIPCIGVGQKYGYRIRGSNGRDCIKIDPYAQEFENPPATASVVSGCDDAYKPPEYRFPWTDDNWVARRRQLAEKRQISKIPMAIYEVHLPSWMRGDGNRYLGYRELAHRLIAHIKSLNMTHVEFLPLAHHPFEGSWGYQVSGLYAPYSRLGDPDGLKYLINELHNNNIGVFLDFVPAHFVKDSWGLVHYDGEPCYEYADPKEGEHKGWGTMIFNFRRNEVRSFLLGAAYHWLRRYHIDGLRIDAVSSMIYKNHCRAPGDWVPNEFGGDANLQAISFLQELNWVVHRQFPGVFTMAEESTSWKGVTDRESGLGFDAKWDLGWMNDTLSYLCTPAALRWEKHSKLTFRGLYMAHERWVLPLSHDEVVNGKGSLLDKCGFSGTPFYERLHTLRTLFGFQVAMPGRPLIFMGSEFGQGREWRENRSVDWHEAQEPARRQVMVWLSDLFKVYCTEKALHAGDDKACNFQWVDCDNAQDNLVGWLRKYGPWYDDVLTVCNFSGKKYFNYPVGVPHGGSWVVLLNSDDWKYGGAMHGPGAGVEVPTTAGGRLGWPWCLWLNVPAFGCLLLKVKKPLLDTEQPVLDQLTVLPCP